MHKKKVKDNTNTLSQQSSKINWDVDYQQPSIQSKPNYKPISIIPTNIIKGVKFVSCYVLHLSLTLIILLFLDKRRAFIRILQPSTLTILQPI